VTSIEFIDNMLRGKNNMTKSLTVTTIVLLIACSAFGAPDEKQSVATASAKGYPITPVDFTRVELNPGFWANRLEVNRTRSIPHAIRMLREDATDPKNSRIACFLLAAGLAELSDKETYVGARFGDTDLYKTIEAASYSLAAKPDSRLEKSMDILIAIIAAAQEDDGYLYTNRTAFENYPDRVELPGMCGPTRWSNFVKGHELYNVGHLYEAATAYYLATGKRSLLDIAIKNADLVDQIFGPDAKIEVPGHPEIAIGLCKLYRVTGEERYLDLANFFVEMRGRRPPRRNLLGSSKQDGTPLLEESHAVGHCVMATYLYSGAADMATLTGDSDYIDAIERIWQDVVSKKIYLTGGFGNGQRGETFGEAYKLPNKEAYNETCAAIGNVFWNHRMFLTKGDAKYIDVLERSLYNGLLSGVSLSGKKFFYPNPLEADGNRGFNHGFTGRFPWFGCACCPGSMVRFIPRVPEYLYAQKDDTIFVNMFAASETTITLGDDPIHIKQETQYPWEETVSITVAPEKPSSFTMAVRIPGWARNEPIPSDLYSYLKPSNQKPELKLNGKRIPVRLKNGFAQIEREWKTGDQIELTLPMPIRRVVANERVEADRGRIAIQRGPIVYCVEAVDNGGSVSNIVLDDNTPLQAEFRTDLLGGCTAITAEAIALRQTGSNQIERVDQQIIAIPYALWSNRSDASKMSVWLPRNDSKARPIQAAQAEK
jgi:DUF1680 family protein